MKISGSALVYLGLVLIILAGVVIPKEVEQPPAHQTFKKERPIVPLAEISLSANLKAEEVNRVLAANTQKVIITEKGDNLLVLINKTIRLPETYEPSDLEGLDGKMSVSQGGLQLRKKVLDALRGMARAAKKDNVNLVVTSAYRSYWTQESTFQYWVGSAGLTSAETFSARPGHYQHQLGTTVDFGSSQTNSGFLSENSRESKWLKVNSYKYGFVLSYPEGKEKITGYMYEPWHYRFIGTRAAVDMVGSGLILEEYLQKYGVW